MQPSVKTFESSKDNKREEKVTKFRGEENKFKEAFQLDRPELSLLEGPSKEKYPEEKKVYSPRVFETKGLEPTIAKVDEPIREEVLPEVEEQDFENLDVRLRFAPESLPVQTETTHLQYLQREFEEEKEFQKEA